MIFVTLGTQDKPFTRILKSIDESLVDKTIEEEVIVQSGFTKFASPNMKIVNLVSPEEFERYIDDARVIITHGGVGSIITALKKGKKIIAVPRLSKFGEHVNDHQLQIVKAFEERKYIIPLYDEKLLKEALKEAKSFQPAVYESNNTVFVGLVDMMIKNLIENK